jgi:Tfp pilus assembly protein PilN
VGGMLAVVALVLGIYVWGELSEVREENAALRARLRELNETARKAVQQRDRIEAIAGWRARDVQWLDELRDLSVRFPPPRDAVLMRMTMRPAQSQGGVIDLQGLVRDPNIVVNMERQVRDRFRNVRSRRIQQRALEDDYTWLFETSVSVFPRRPDQYLAPPPTDLEPSPGLESEPLAAAEGDKENIP